jgi:hypothetical protein
VGPSAVVVDGVLLQHDAQVSLPVGCQKSAWPVSCGDDQGQS